MCYLWKRRGESYCVIFIYIIVKIIIMIAMKMVGGGRGTNQKLVLWSHNYISIKEYIAYARLIFPLKIQDICIGFWLIVWFYSRIMLNSECKNNELLISKLVISIYITSMLYLDVIWSTQRFFTFIFLLMSKVCFS